MSRCYLITQMRKGHYSDCRTIVNNPLQLAPATAPHHHHRAYLSRAQEEDLKTYCEWMGERGWPLTTSMLRQLAGELSATGLPTIRWAQRFAAKHDFSKRAAKENKKVSGDLSWKVIEDILDMLNQYIQKHNLEAEQILNMIETGWGKTQQIRQKYLFKKGSKNTFKQKVFSVDHITTVHSGTATGVLLPVMIIFKGSLPFWNFVDQLPNNWIFAVSDSEYMLQNIFVEWVLGVLVPYALKIHKRVLCVLDNASCHLSVKAINICIKHNIDLLALPPNCTSFLQPFDQVFGLLKSALYSVAHEHSLLIRGTYVHKNNFVFALKAGINRAFNTKVIWDAFRNTGIFPPNVDILNLNEICELDTGEPDPQPGSASDGNGDPSPCQSCGAIRPCTDCVRKANYLVKINIFRDPSCAAILTPPIDYRGTQKPVRIRGGRLLTSEQVRDTLAGKCSAKKNTHEKTTDKPTDERTNDDDMVTAPEQPVPRDEPAPKQPDQNPRPNPTTTRLRKSRNRDSCVVLTDQLPTILPIKRRKRRPTPLPNDDI